MSTSPASQSSAVTRSVESARDADAEKPPAAQPPAAQPPVMSQPAATPPATPLPNEPQPATGTQARDSLLASAAEYQGWKTWHVYCYRCHGVDAVGGQLAPDLRRSVSSEGGINRESFITVAKEGRVEKGMPAWSALLSDDQIVNIYAYVKARSERRLAARRPHAQQ